MDSHPHFFLLEIVSSLSCITLMIFKSPCLLRGSKRQVSQIHSRSFFLGKKNLGSIPLRSLENILASWEGLEGMPLLFLEVLFFLVEKVYKELP